MRLSIPALVAFLFVAPSCEALAEAGVTMPNISEILAGITDGQSAEEAEGPLSGAVDQLKAALAGGQEEAEAGAAEGAAAGEGMTDKVLAQFGVGPETADTIKGLLDNPEVKAVLGSTLEQLMGMISG